MARKKWTPTETITDSLLKFREKRKWQLALRRYVIEKKPSEYYAPFFGIDIENYRKWIELQLDSNLTWQNFGSHWQFEHIVPVNYFDYSNNDDLILCWNFINVRIGSVLSNLNSKHIDIIAAMPYFKDLYDKTGYSICFRMVKKLERIINKSFDEPNLENFIISNKAQLEKLTFLTGEEFGRINHGTTIKDIFLEREILKRFS